MEQYIYTLPEGTVLNGPKNEYTILSVLGQGTFGITYLATTKMEVSGKMGTFETTVQVAVKEFFMRDFNGRKGLEVTSSSQGSYFSDYKRKFLREAENLSKLEHTNIVKVLESFKANNTAYYAMEYLEGGSLDNLIQKKRALTETEAMPIIRQIGTALMEMHRHRMLHLDLKPNNVMLRKSNEAVLIDFGLSKQFDKDGKPESSTSLGGGTPGYAPMEQPNYQRGDGLPMTMDIYALGATIYKMLTGVRPPEASVVFNDGFPRPTLVEKGVSGHMISVIEKAMSPAHRSRYQSVKEMLKDLVDDTIIDPPPPDNPEPREPFLTRILHLLPWKQITIFIGASLGGLLLVYGATHMYQYIKEEQAKRVQAANAESQRLSNSLTKAISTNDKDSIRIFAVEYDSVRAYLPYAQICYDENNLDIAEEYARKMLPNPEATTLITKIENKRKSIETAAQAELQQKQREERFDSLFNAAKAQYDDHQYVPAKTTLGKIENGFQSRPKVKDLLNKIDTAIKKEKLDQKYEEYLSKAKAAFNRKKYAEAQSFIDKIKKEQGKEYSQRSEVTGLQVQIERIYNDYLSKAKNAFKNGTPPYSEAQSYINKIKNELGTTYSNRNEVVSLQRQINEATNETDQQKLDRAVSKKDWNTVRSLALKSNCIIEASGKLAMHYIDLAKQNGNDRENLCRAWYWSNRSDARTKAEVNDILDLYEFDETENCDNIIY